MNIFAMIALGFIISLLVGSIVGSAIATVDPGDPEYTTEMLLAVLRREKWKMLALKCDPIESVRVLDAPPYDQDAEEVVQ